MEVSPESESYILASPKGWCHRYDDNKSVYSFHPVINKIDCASYSQRWETLCFRCNKPTIALLPIVQTWFTYACCIATVHRSNNTDMLVQYRCQIDGHWIWSLHNWRPCQERFSRFHWRILRLVDRNQRHERTHARTTMNASQQACDHDLCIYAVFH